MRAYRCAAVLVGFALTLLLAGCGVDCGANKDEASCKTNPACHWNANESACKS